MTKFTKEQHRKLQLNCIQILKCVEDMRLYINNEESLKEELLKINEILMSFSLKMIGK